MRDAVTEKVSRSISQLSAKKCVRFRAGATASRRVGGYMRPTSCVSGFYLDNPLVASRRQPTAIWAEAKTVDVFCMALPKTTRTSDQFLVHSLPKIAAKQVSGGIARAVVIKK